MISTVVFDLGGVLIDWNPRYLYRKLLRDEREIEAFLGTVCTPEWNHQQDAGRSWAAATSELIDRFPQYGPLIRAYWERWEEMLGDSIHSSVELLERLSGHGVRLLALTNWSSETFPVARRRYPFLDRFEGIVVSGEEGVAKPDPTIYRILVERFRLDPAEAVFIDDQPSNVASAHTFGLAGHVYRDRGSLELFLRRAGLNV